MFSKLDNVFACIRDKAKWKQFVPAGVGRVKIGGSSNAEEQQQLKKHGGVGSKQRQGSLWTGSGKVLGAEGAVSKCQSATEQHTSRPSRDPSIETSDRRGKHQQQPVTCQVGSTLSNTGAFLLLSQVKNSYFYITLFSLFSNSWCGEVSVCGLVLLRRHSGPVSRKQAQ